MKKIVIKTLGDPITIREEDLSNHKLECRGYWDPKVGEIVIDSTIDEIDKHAVLIHEFMHLIDDVLVQNGVRKKRSSHELILHMADNLLVLLIVSGLITKFTIEEVFEFQKRMVDNWKEGDETLGIIARNKK